MVMAVMDVAEALYEGRRPSDLVLHNALCTALNRSPERSPGPTADLRASALEQQSIWTAEMDSQLVQWITLLTAPSRSSAGRSEGQGEVKDGEESKPHATPLDIAPSKLSMTSVDDKLTFTLISELPPLSLRVRAALLQWFNKLLTKVSEAMRARSHNTGLIDA
jgi:hypothetical protein